MATSMRGLSRMRNQYKNNFKEASHNQSVDRTNEKNLLCDKIIFLQGEYLKMEVLLKETNIIILLRSVNKQGQRYRLQIKKDFGLKFIIQKCKGNAQLISNFLEKKDGTITLNIENKLNLHSKNAELDSFNTQKKSETIGIDLDKAINSKRSSEVSMPALQNKLAIQKWTVQNIVHPFHKICADSSNQIRPVILNHGIQTSQKLIPSQHLTQANTTIDNLQYRLAVKSQQLYKLNQRFDKLQEQCQRVKKEERRIRRELDDAKQEIRERNRQTDISLRYNEHQFKRQGRKIMVASEMEKIFSCI